MFTLAMPRVGAAASGHNVSASETRCTASLRAH